MVQECSSPFNLSLKREFASVLWQFEPLVYCGFESANVLRHDEKDSAANPYSAECRHWSLHMSVELRARDYSNIPGLVVHRWNRDNGVLARNLTTGATLAQSVLTRNSYLTSIDCFSDWAEREYRPRRWDEEGATTEAQFLNQSLIVFLPKVSWCTTADNDTLA